MAIIELATLAEVPQSQEGNSIFVCLNDAGNGALRVDVRRWFVGDDGEWHPTQKGISLTADSIQPVIDALVAGKKDIEARVKATAAATKKSAPVKAAAPKPSTNGAKAPAKKATPKAAAAKKVATRRR